MTRPLAKISMLLVAIACVAWLVISKHARESHATETWDAMTVLETIKGAYNNNDDRTCKSLFVAMCPNAVNVYTGISQPHAKVFCELKNKGTEKLYAVGIFGLALEQPIYVTGYSMTEWRMYKVCERDGCVVVNLSTLGNLLR